ncbi:MAG: phosphoglycerate mutase family protein [Tamlana sp.]
MLLVSCKKENQTIQPTANNNSVYYFIRHAEKDKSDSLNNNPHLTEKGLQRADKWNQVFKNISFNAIYSTDYNRTRETASPTAKDDNLEPVIYNPKSINIETSLNENKGKTVLVVGHSNTTTNLVNRVLKKDTYNEIDDTNNSNLYIVTVNDKSISSSLLFIE